jgi:hypothetical protein
VKKSKNIQSKKTIATAVATGKGDAIFTEYCDFLIFEIKL